LPRGTAYQTDAGMCGDYDSVIGMHKAAAVARFVTKMPGERLQVAEGPATLCGVVVETDDATGLARRIAPVRTGGRLVPSLPTEFATNSYHSLVDSSRANWSRPSPRNKIVDAAFLPYWLARQHFGRMPRGQDAAWCNPHRDDSCSEMAGHSQFKNIMHRKGAQDKKRAKIFTKIIRELTTAARTGLPDPNANPRLRAAVFAARAANMPKDTVDRAIKRGSGGDDGEAFEE